jgi:hypothetical protein
LSVLQSSDFCFWYLLVIVLSVLLWLLCLVFFGHCIVCPSLITVFGIFKRFLPEFTSGFYSEVRIAPSLVFYVVFCPHLFVFLSLFPNIMYVLLRITTFNYLHKQQCFYCHLHHCIQNASRMWWLASSSSVL